MRWEEFSATVKLLRLCAAAKDRIQGQELHALLAKSGHDTRTLIGNHLVKMYGDCGLVDDAWAAFRATKHRNVFSWNILMAAAADGGETVLARDVFDRMPLADIVSWNAILGIHARAREIDSMYSIFKEMPERDSCSWNTVIAALAQAWHLDRAEMIFRMAPRTSVITWNTMISAYASCQDIVEAETIFVRMPERDATSWNALVTAVAVCWDLERAAEVLRLMPQHTLSAFNVFLTAHCSQGRLEEARILLLDGSLRQNSNLVSWSAVIAGYTQAGRGRDSLQLFRLMDLDGIQPDNITFISVACAIAGIQSIFQARILLRIVQDQALPPDVPLGTNLINMFAKCGDLTAARRVFEEMPLRDIVAWNAMITAYAQAGQVDRSLELYHVMLVQGILPVLVTFVTVLSCCSHAGLLRQALEFFHSIRVDFGLVPGFEQYRCMIDLLGRAGHLEEAEELIDAMPFEPDGVVWNTLLGACRNYRDLERAERIGLKIFLLDQEVVSSYTLLSCTYL